MKTIVVDNPLETCEIEPQRTCKHVTKLVPRLVAAEECVDVPKEVTFTFQFASYHMCPRMSFTFTFRFASCHMYSKKSLHFHFFLFQVCSRSKSNPRKIKKPIIKKWCYVPSKESGLQ